MKAAPGPAVQLANAESLFPHLLARAWRARGLDPVIVCALRPVRLPPEAGDARIVDVSMDVSRPGAIAKRLAKPVILPIEHLTFRLNAARVRATTNRTAPPHWEPFVIHVINAFRVARAARRLSPLFAFGHEVTAYGLATALCRGTPRILFPWGNDVFASPEISPWHFWLVRRALRSADLIVPASVVAARHIVDRFGVDPARVQAVSWGAELTQFRRSSADGRGDVCGRWAIDPDHRVIMNARRFVPLGNCFTVIDAFLRVAQERPDTHFVIPGGTDTEDHIKRAQAQVAAAGPDLAGRFTFFQGNAALQTLAELMGVTDVFVSLYGRGDMRSKSVLQASAAGGVPVIGELPEYRMMQAEGFAARFVDPEDPAQVAASVIELLDDDELRSRIRDQNWRYLAEHEDGERQMDRLLAAIMAVVDRRR